MRIPERQTATETQPCVYSLYQKHFNLEDRAWTEAAVDMESNGSQNAEAKISERRIPRNAFGIAEVVALRIRSILLFPIRSNLTHQPTSRSPMHDLRSRSLLICLLCFRASKLWFWILFLRSLGLSESACAGDSLLAKVCSVALFRSVVGDRFIDSVAQLSASLRQTAWA